MITGFTVSFDFTVIWNSCGPSIPLCIWVAIFNVPDCPGLMVVKLTTA